MAKDYNTETPLRPEQVREMIKPRAAVAPKPITIRHHLQVAGTDEAPEAHVKVLRRGPHGGHASSLFDYDITVEVNGVRVDQRAQPGAVEVRTFRRRELRSAQAVPTQPHDPFIPDHLTMTSFPEPIGSPRPAPARAVDPQRRVPTTVFSPDERKVYQDTAYPWGTIGRVESPRGVGSGVMVGPRHLLTVSHIVDWHVPSGAGWLRFTPGYFNGGQPFGQALATQIYAYVHEDGGGINSHEQFDFVIAVLDTRIGDACGWMGSRPYIDVWDGLPVWWHAGYPAGLTRTQRPIYQSQIALDGDNQQADEHQAILHRGDVESGQSGGPMFAWFDAGPCAVAVQSWHNDATNGASGGRDLDALLTQAKADHP